MRKRLPFVIIFLALSGCQIKNSNEHLYKYKSNDALFLEAKKMIKKEYPEYFLNIPESQVNGLQVYGEKVECVYIFNKSGIIAERHPPLYCFDYHSRKFATRL